MKELRMLSIFSAIIALLMLPGFTCSKNIPKENRKEVTNDYSIIAYKGTTSERISTYNTKVECEELKSKLEEKNPDVVYRCRQ